MLWYFEVAPWIYCNKDIFYCFLPNEELCFKSQGPSELCGSFRFAHESNSDGWPDVNNEFFKRPEEGRFEKAVEGVALSLILGVWGILDISLLCIDDRIDGKDVKVGLSGAARVSVGSLL